MNLTREQLIKDLKIEPTELERDGMIESVGEREHVISEIVNSLIETKIDKMFDKHAKSKNQDWYLDPPHCFHSI